MTETEADAARDLSAAIGRNYNSLVYEPQVVEAVEALEPPSVLGLAAVYGCVPDAGSDFDVLDLGCGTGTQLFQAGIHSRGRLVGADISDVACQRARERCAKYGDRVEIVCANFLDLAPEALGKFDLIYCLGVIFLTPAIVQQRILDLIGQCLKPGGAVLINYYAGSLPMIRAALHRLLRASVDPALTTEETIRRARQLVEDIAAMLPPTGPHRRILLQALDHARAQTDTLFFHEALNHVFTVLDTPSLDASLGRHGAQFLNYMTPNAFGALATSRERARGVDVVDFASGGSYRYAVFGKPAGTGAVSLRSPRLRWRSRLVRTEAPGTYGAPAFYRDVATSADVQIVQSHTQAALDLLSVRGATWSEIWDGVQVRLSARGRSPTAKAETYLEQDLTQLWDSRLIVPSWEPAPPR
jgi:SAM-dependent methyltransferase